MEEKRETKEYKKRCAITMSQPPPIKCWFTLLPGYQDTAQGLSQNVTKAAESYFEQYSVAHDRAI